MVSRNNKKLRKELFLSENNSKKISLTKWAWSWYEWLIFYYFCGNNDASELTVNIQNSKAIQCTHIHTHLTHIPQERSLNCFIIGLWTVNSEHKHKTQTNTYTRAKSDPTFGISALSRFNCYFPLIAPLQNFDFCVFNSIWSWCSMNNMFCLLVFSILIFVFHLSLMYWMLVCPSKMHTERWTCIQKKSVISWEEILKEEQKK